MKAIQGIWKDGRIVPTQPVDWPDGTTLSIEPVEEPAADEAEEDLLGNDPESIARWIAWYESLQPLIFTPEEEAAWHAARQAQRDWDKARFDGRAERLKGLFE